MREKVFYSFLPRDELTDFINSFNQKKRLREKKDENNNLKKGKTDDPNTLSLDEIPCPICKNTLKQV